MITVSEIINSKRALTNVAGIYGRILFGRGYEVRLAEWSPKPNEKEVQELIIDNKDLRYALLDQVSTLMGGGPLLNHEALVDGDVRSVEGKLHINAHRIRIRERDGSSNWKSVDYSPDAIERGKTRYPNIGGDYFMDLYGIPGPY